MTVKELTNLEQLVECLCEEIDSSASASERRNSGGQQTNGGFYEFELVPPSVMARLKWWSRKLRENLPKV